LGEYKKGAAIAAISSGATIVPVIMVGTAQVWPYGDWRLRSGKKVDVRFLAPMDTKGMTIEDRTVLTQRLRSIAEASLVQQSAGC